MSEDTYTEDNSQVVAVWSSFDHRFMSDGDEDTESCLTCGAVYRLLALAGDPTRGEYVADGGDEPMRCSGDTMMAHGYPGERVCAVNGGRGCENGCEHCEHNCNCVLCG